mgnify:FL=1
MEAPSVEALHGELGDTAAVIGVAWAGSEASYSEFVERHGLSFPNIDDTAGEIYSRYSVASQPAWVFVRNGEHRTMRGVLTADEVREAVAAAG